MDERQRYTISVDSGRPLNQSMTLQQASSYAAAIIRDEQPNRPKHTIYLEGLDRHGNALGNIVAERRLDGRVRYDPDLENDGDGHYFCAAMTRAQRDWDTAHPS